MGINHAKNGSAYSAMQANFVAATTDQLANRRARVDQADAEFGGWVNNPWRVGGKWGPKTGGGG